MIVLGVLTALVLEQAAQAVLHARAAQATKTMLDAEIRSNLASIRRLRSVHAERSQSMAELAQLLLKDMKAKVPDPQIIEHFERERAAGKYFGMIVNTPHLQNTAWDIAVADQSAGWMDARELRRYASVYSVHKMLPDHVRAKMPHVLNGPGMVDVESDLEMGNVDPRVLYRATRQMIEVLKLVDSNLNTAEAITLRTFPELAHKAASEVK